MGGVGGGGTGRGGLERALPLVGCERPRLWRVPPHPEFAGERCPGPGHLLQAPTLGTEALRGWTCLSGAEAFALKEHVKGPWAGKAGVGPATEQL